MQKVEPYKLATLPQILLALQEELLSPMRTFSSVSEIISKDPALMMRVIVVATSACPQAIPQAGSLTELCSTIGYDELQAIAMSSATYQAFADYQDDQIAYLEHHWSRAFFGAQVALSLAKISAYREPEQAYLCALVREIGQLVMEVQSNGLVSVKMAAGSSSAEMLTYEVEQFGVNHHLLSAQLIDDWGVNPGFSDAVKYQAKPVDAIRDAHDLVKIVNLASRAIEQSGGKSAQFINDANTLFAIDASTAQAILVKSRGDAINEANHYGVHWRDAFTADDLTEDSGGSLQVLKPEHIGSQRFREKHLELKRQVKDISLISSVCRATSATDTEEELLSTVRNALKSLLNTSASMFFLYGKHTDTIKVAGHRDVPEFLKEIAIPVDHNRSLLSNSLLDNEPVYFFTDDADELESLAVVDRQFLNHLGTSGFYGYPLSFEGKRLGVILLGVEQSHVDGIAESRQLVQMLMTKLGGLLKEFYWVQERQLDIAENQTKTYEMSVKKAIHEANNPLSVVQNYLEIMGQKLDDNSSAKENLLIVKSEITRVCDILGRIGRQNVAEDPVFTLFDLNQLVSDQVKIFDTSNVYANQVETKLALDEDMPSIWGSENALKQILTNLILNSIEAMPTGGKVSVSTADQFYINDTCYVEISIQDTGPGIDASVMPHLFEVKRSLKGKKHSGVGLNIVHNLVTQMNGLITCRNSRQGVTWQILLPRTPAR
ncbi:MAG: HDOD domain-containing protein [Pseudomonadales bacterium]|nr:HDOD domain-containing protein [Pseudomonadales bacterium]